MKYSKQVDSLPLLPREKATTNTAAKDHWLR